MLKLVIEDDEGKQTVVPLIRDEITIGRKEGNTIRLTERNISRRHCRLVKQSGTVFVEDLQSYNGVRMNGVRIAARTPIADADTVAVGDYKLQVRYDRPGAATTAPTAVVPSAAGKATSLGMSPAASQPAAGGSEIPTSPGLPRIDAPSPTGGHVPHPVPAPAPFGAVPFPAATTPAPAALPSPALLATFPAAPAPVAPGGSAIPSAALEGSPTIPVRTLADQNIALGMAPTASVQTPAAKPARLVVVSTELGGSEFALDRPSAVIGRTEENDVMLNHRSISRHHAKIVRDAERYTIVDLQSANGVRVNGEPYERIELHPGDVIELGHVRMRFVGPGETFTFDTFAPGARGSRRNWKPIAFVGGGVALAAVLGVMFLGGDGAKPKSKLVEVTPGEPAATKSGADEPAKAPPPTVVPVVTESAAELIAMAEEQAKGEKWDEAVATMDKAVAKDGSEARARDLKQRYEAERKNAELYAKFKGANDEKNYDDAMFAYSEITEDSLYKDRGKGLYQSARKQFVGKHLDLAEKLRAQGKCADVESESKLVLTVDEKNKAAREVVRLCKPKLEKPVAVAAAEPPPEAKAPPADRPVRAPRERVARAPREPKAVASAAASPASAAKPAAPAETGDPKSLVDAGRQAWVRGQYAAAIDSARKALKIKPGYTDAYLIIAVASCSLRDGDGATRAYGKLDDKMKGMVRSSCQKNGISLE